jgi:exodeoxyribonuclease VII small subunit
MSRSSRQSSLDDQNPPAATLTFEQALDELEQLVGRMEGGDLSLEQSLASHKRGLELAKFCQDKLESAQQQVRVLEGEILKALPSAQALDPSGK